jgi:hypothetical protein
MTPLGQNDRRDEYGFTATDHAEMAAWHKTLEDTGTAPCAAAVDAACQALKDLLWQHLPDDEELRGGMYLALEAAMPAIYAQKAAS